VYNLKVSVIGAGAQGSATAFVLTKISDATVVAADVNLNVARKAVESIKSDKVSAEKVDASKIEDVVRVAEGSDVIVNACMPRFNFNIMEAALKTGANYIDYAGDVPCKDFVPKELAYDAKFKDAGLTAVIFTGGPFVTNAAIKYAADRLDSVDEIRMRLGGTPREREFIPTWTPGWCPEIALVEWINPMVYENGKWKDVPPFSGVEEYMFPEPVGGPVTVTHVDYEPVHTLPRFIKGVKYVEQKNHPDIMAGSLIKMGFANKEPIDVKGVKVAPIDVLLALTPTATETRAKTGKERTAETKEKESYFCSLAEIKGEKDGEKITHTVFRLARRGEEKERWGRSGVSVGVPGGVTAVMIEKGEIKTKGVVPPEGLDVDLYLSRMAENGFVYHETITRSIRV
jgi:saccharopine dehydrogenase-like NADP-dependent oxidoreductase